MMDLLKTFAALSLSGSVILSLLPEGSLRRTAAMAVGLLTLLCWAEGLMKLFSMDVSALAPSTVLTATGVDIDAAAQAVRESWEAAD